MTASLTTAAPLLGEPLPVELMNTLWADRSGIHDALAGDPVRVLEWLAAVSDRLGLADAPGLRDDLGVFPVLRGESATIPDPGASALQKFAGDLVSVRDALRRLAAEQTGDPRERARTAGLTVSDAVDRLNEAAAGGFTWKQLSWTRSGPRAETLATSPLSEVVVALLAREGVELFSGEHRTRLRACLAPGCVLYFVKQHPRREWCSAGCGNRARFARHYERRRHGDG